MGHREEAALSILLWEKAIDDETMKAYRQYQPILLDAILAPDALRTPTENTVTAAIAPPPPDPDAIMLTESQWARILEETLIPRIGELSDARMIAILEAAGIAIPAGGITVEALYAIPQYVAWRTTYLEDVSNRMVNTPDEIFRGIASDLAEGIDKGEDAYWLARRVQQHLSMDAEGGLGRWMQRANRVARTEATGAFNATNVAAAQVQSEVYGQELEQVWVASMDSRTRKTHFAADGQRRPLGGKFAVGRADLRYPGDPRGPAREVVNCRCSILTIEVGEPLPGEDDRQTERERSDGTTRDPGAEVERRAEDGVIRARDDDDGEGKITAAAGTGDRAMGRKWSGTLAPLGKETGDGRMFSESGTFSFREFPLPLMWQEQTGYGHESSYTVGAILEASVEGGVIVGTGVLFDTPEAVKAEALLDSEGGPVTRPSVDLCDDEWMLVDPDGNEVSEEQLWEAWDRGEEPDVLMMVTSATIMGATLVAKPAFAEAKIVLDDADSEDEISDDDLEQVSASLVASVGTLTEFVADAAMFEDPKFTRITPLHMDDHGRVKGHLATWGVCHVGIQGKCVTAPSSETDYAYFHVSEVQTDKGPIPCGRLTIGGGHANGKFGISATQEHYDNAGAAWAMVRAGEDEFGIWVSGVPHPSATKEQILDGSTHPLSGDWRRVAGNLELVAALGVVSGGFPVPRGARDEHGRDISLVASGVVPIDKRSPGQGRSAEAVARIAQHAAEAAVAAYVKRENDQRALAAFASDNREKVGDTRSTAESLAASIRKAE